MRARREDLQTFFGRSPFQYVDVDVANAPSLHVQAARFVEIDCIRSNQGGAVIIDHVLLLCPDDAKSSPERKTRPIGSGAHDMLARENFAHGITSATLFGVGISRCSNSSHPVGRWA